MQEIGIMDVGGFQVGHAQDLEEPLDALSSSATG